MFFFAFVGRITIWESAMARGMLMLCMFHTVLFVSPIHTYKFSVLNQTAMNRPIYYILLACLFNIITLNLINQEAILQWMELLFFANTLTTKYACMLMNHGVGGRWGRGVKGSGQCSRVGWQMQKTHITGPWEGICLIRLLLSEDNHWSWFVHSHHHYWVRFCMIYNFFFGFKVCGTIIESPS